MKQPGIGNLAWVRFSAALCVAMLSLTTGFRAQAADQPAGMIPPPKTDERGWIVTVSVIGAVAPSFPGSAQLRPYPFPSISVRSSDEPERFSAPDDGFGFAVIDQSDIRVGPVANFVFRRGERDGLFGLRSVPLTHEVGGFIEATPVDYLRARAEFRQGVDGHNGFVASFGADLHGLTGPFLVSAGPRLNVGDNRYANAYFSVSPYEAALNGRLLPYQATGGFTSAGALATIRYDFPQGTTATLFTGLQRLTGSVGSSPIPSLIGSRNQFTAGLSIGHSFFVRKFW